MATVLQEYKGDMFGTGGDYLDSMIYLSRMADAGKNKFTRYDSSEASCVCTCMIRNENESQEGFRRFR